MSIGRDGEPHVGVAVDGRDEVNASRGEVEVVDTELTSRIRAWNEIDPRIDHDESPVKHAWKHLTFLTTCHRDGPEFRIAIVLCVVDVRAIG